MASNASQLGLGALAAAVVGVGVVWLVPTPERQVVAPTGEVQAVAVVPTEEDPETAVETEQVEVVVDDMQVSPLAVPTVGMRAEGDGIMVVTGRAEGASELDILLDGQPLERIMVSTNGDYATVLSIEPSSKGRILSVVANPGAEAVASVENPLILPTVEEEPLLSEEEVVVAGAVTAVDDETLIEALENTGEVATEIDVQDTAETEVAAGEPEIETAGVEVATDPVVEDVEVAINDQVQVEDSDLPDAQDDVVSVATSEVETEQPTTVVEATNPEATEEEPIAESIASAQEAEGDALDMAEVVAAKPEVVADVEATEDLSETADAPQTQLVADAEGVRVVPTGPGPQVLSNVALDSISYDPTGEVLLTGRATGEGFVQVYVDNKPVTTSRITEGGGWRTDLPEVDTGVYTLRIDEVDAQGDVVSRIETPFKREEPETVAAVLAEETADDDFKVAVKTVQPGATLWAIAREQFGEGILYVAVYEANRDQIRDPDLIYPGQVFKMPELTE